MLSHQRITIRNGRRDLALTALLASLAMTTVASSAELAAEPGRYALLVGCTEYPLNEHIPPLRGPANDVHLFGDLLKSRFGFAEENITRLVGWPDDEAARPTLANIAAAFDQLIEQAKPGDQVVILLAGHGTQLPIPEDQEDPWDPANPEPDGMDEYFLPADVGRWTRDGFQNAIRDNTIGDWLDRLREKGASVWIIFDCCHAGTMSRSIQDIEWPRSVTPAELGVPDELLKNVARKVCEAHARQSEREPPATVPPIRLPETNGRSSLVAFYAAQPHELAPELPLPRGAPNTAEHIHGQFSYALCQALEQTEGTLTYRDLTRRIVSMYRAERGSRAPTPLFDGDLDRDVLGANLGLRVPIYLEQTSDGMHLSAGALIGLTPGTILSVHPPGGAGREGDEVLGYVGVRAVSPTSATVESVSYDGREAVSATDLPNAALCRIVVQDVGDMEVRVAIEGDDAPPSLLATLRDALGALPPEVAQLVRVVDNVAEAEWVLRVVSPEAAREQFAMAIDAPKVFLLPGSGRKETADRDFSPQLFAQYPARDREQLAHALRLDLHKIFAWQNVWRVADSLETSRAVEDSDVEFQVLRLGTSPAAEDQRARHADHVLHPGQRLQLRLANRGFYDQWVTLLYLGADYRIEQPVARMVRAGDELPPLVVTIDDSSFGAEGFIVMSVRARAHRNQPDYSFLVQPPLGGEQRQAATRAPQNPFERLMHSITATSAERVRSVALDTPTTPQLLSWTWVTVPKP